VPGSYVKGNAFPTYALGRPKIDEVYVYFVATAQQAVAGVLAGTLDLPLGDIIQVDEGIVLKQELEARGEGSIVTKPFSMRVASIQFRDPTAPAARSLRVRQALVHAVDRRLMVEALHHGMTAPADTFVFPSDSTFPRVDRSITKRPADANRAAQLISEAGWAPGEGHVLRDQAGQPFALEVQALEGTQYVKEAQVVAADWSALGIAPELKVIPRARQNDREYRAAFTGVEMHSYSPGPGSLRNWRVDEIPTEASRWQGGNRGAFVNPTVNQLTLDFDVTLDRAKREDMLAEVLQLVSEEIPTIPFYYTVRVYAVRAGLRGIDPAALGEGYPMFNVHAMYWER
jgi:peptide/nickel transport system substrate-binding protein